MAGNGMSQRFSVTRLERKQYFHMLSKTADFLCKSCFSKNSLKQLLYCRYHFLHIVNYKNYNCHLVRCGWIFQVKEEVPRRSADDEKREKQITLRHRSNSCGRRGAHAHALFLNCFAATTAECLAQLHWLLAAQTSGKSRSRVGVVFCLTDFVLRYRSVSAAKELKTIALSSFMLHMILSWIMPA